MVVLAGPAHARTFTVDSPQDQGDQGPGDGICDSDNFGCTVRAAVDEANAFSGDPSDTIAVPAGSYQLTQGELQIDSRITLTGAGAASTVIHRAAGVSGFRIFHVTGKVRPGRLVISGVTVRGRQRRPFSSGGGILNEGSGLLTLRNSAITGNRRRGARQHRQPRRRRHPSIGAGGLAVGGQFGKREHRR